MLKTVSSVANALGALNYKGTWDADTNTPTLASGVGTQGDYYVVSVAGTTDLDGITNWGVGDWAAFNGSVWQRVEGGADGNFVNLTVTGTSELDGNVAIGAGVTPTYPLTIEKDSDSWISRIYNSGSDADANALLVRSDATAAHNAVIIAGYADGGYKMLLKSSGNLELLAGNLVIGTSGKGIDFSATAGTGTSELFDDYEEGLWTPTVDSGTCAAQYGSYIKIGKMVHATFSITNLSDTTTASAINVSLPFTAGSFSASEWLGSWIIRRYDVSTSASGAMRVLGNGTTMDFRYSDTTVGSEPKSVNYDDNTSGLNEYLSGSITYFTES